MLPVDRARAEGRLEPWMRRVLGLAWGRECPIWGRDGKPTPTTMGRFL